jgi:hypothetical protein
MKVLFVGSVAITDIYLATDEPSLLLYCLHCLSDIVGFIFKALVNEWFPSECLADCRLYYSWNNAVIDPLKTASNHMVVMVVYL